MESGGGNNFDLFLYAPDRNQVANSTRPVGVTDSLSVFCSSTGWWFIEVRNDGGFGNYIMSVD
jgi:hypothetical protein